MTNEEVESEAYEPTNKFLEIASDSFERLVHVQLVHHQEQADIDNHTISYTLRSVQDLLIVWRPDTVFSIIKGENWGVTGPNKFMCKFHP